MGTSWDTRWFLMPSGELSEGLVELADYWTCLYVVPPCVLNRYTGATDISPNHLPDIRFRRES